MAPTKPDEATSKWRTDPTEDHPLFGADPWDYFAGQKWREGIAKTCGPKGFWLKITADLDGEITKPYWVWIDG